MQRKEDGYGNDFKVHCLRGGGYDNLLEANVFFEKTSW